MNTYHGTDLKNLPLPADEHLLTALASFVVGAGFAIVIIGAWLAGI